MPKISQLPIKETPTNYAKLVGVDEGETVQIPINQVIHVTYAELKDLRGYRELIPGMFYRITDYECTTSQEGTRAMNHRFDIIVQALSEDRLSEIAKADFNEYDTYFSGNGANLAAWEIKYCLDNDATRFAWCGQCITNLQSGFSQPGEVLVRCPDFDWATGLDDYVYAWGTEADVEDGDSNNFIYSKSPVLQSSEVVYLDGEFRLANVDSYGKGVIYYMKDEHGNECAYDFKNIQFLKWISHDDEGHPYYDEEWGDEDWCYTFCGNQYNIDDDEWSYLLDGSVCSHVGKNVDNMYTFHSNVIKAQRYDDNYWETKSRLNGIVLFGMWSVEGGRVDYVSCCFDNAFEDDCFNITLSAECARNHFERYCSDIDMAKYSYDNNFSRGCCYIYAIDTLQNSSFGRSCCSNILHGGYDIIFGPDCMNNTFEGWCSNITFGRNCCFNTICDGANNITLGGFCEENTFGQGANTVTLEPHCCYNTIENETHDIQLRACMYGKEITSSMSGYGDSGLRVYSHQGIVDDSIQ